MHYKVIFQYLAVFITGFLTLGAPEVKQHENPEVFEVFFPPKPAAGHPAEIAARINLEEYILKTTSLEEARQQKVERKEKCNTQKTNTEFETMRPLIWGYLSWDRKR